MHVVVGASGATGSALVHELLHRGQKVRAVNRSGKADLPSGVELVGADAANHGQMREVCAGASAVYNCVNPPFADWQADFPEVNRSLAEAAGAAGAVLAFADDTWMYGKVDRPMTEDMPSRPVTHLGVMRAWLADMLLDAHHRGDTQVVIARGGELYGPRVESLFGHNLFSRAVLGHRPVWFGSNPDLPITPTYINDFARALATVAAEPQAWGEVWHAPTGPPTTAREFAGTLCEQLGRPAKLWSVPSGLTLPIRMVSATARKGAEILYQYEQPFIVDSAKYDTKFGEAPAKSYSDGIAETVAWLQEDASRVHHSIIPV